ncbi:hypothetical protein CC1_20670 [Coprococcus catus GD/7]|uniref:DUF4349 domain-containing protein n=1 Tax=Coprococcus catus GD/7 TaxID=717962 RepID=D4J8W4_9FIRM|nr:DUF4349 domain-containing protein [Coprococcus catus]CBK80785.1 hypothetical protein CC1_20670 [Coprococcus catus GD/7]
MKNQKLFMKKALAVFLASSCIVGLPACSGKNATTTNETSQSQIASETVKETEKKDVEETGDSKETETETETETVDETANETADETADEAAEESNKNDPESADTLADVYVGSKDLEAQADGKSPDTTVYTYSVRAADYNAYIDSVKKELDSAGGYIAKQDKLFYSTEEKKAYLVLRVPRDGSADFAQYIQSAGTVDKSDHVTDKVKNMTSVIDDHVTALQQEQTNLLEMAVKTEDTSTVLSLQSRIADITYEINAYNSKMHVLDEDKQYDSIIINFTEDRNVAFTPRVNNVFRKIITGIGKIFIKCAVVVCAVLPIAAIIGLVVFIVTTAKKKKQEKETQQIADYAKRISEAKNKDKVVDGAVIDVEDKKLLGTADEDDEAPIKDSQYDCSNDGPVVNPEADDIDERVNEDIEVADVKEEDDTVELDEIERTLNELDRFPHKH